MRLLNRYVLREHAGPLVFSLAALTSLMLLNYVAKEFGKLAGKGLPWRVIGEFFALAVPFTVAMTLPMAVLVATLHAFGRLAAENEITALKASGISINRLLLPVLAGGMALSLVMVFFNDQVLPRANHRLRNLQEDIAQKKPTFALRPQVINAIQEGKLYLRAGRVEASTNRLREVAIFDLGDPAKRRTIYADSGDLALAGDGSDLKLTLYHGYMQEASRQSPGELQRLFYHVNNIRVRGVGNQLKHTENDFKGDREMSICEMGSQVDQLHGELAMSARDLSRHLENQALMLATGQVLQAERQPPAAAPPASLAGYYCGAVAWVASLAAPRPPPGPGLPGARAPAQPGLVDPSRPPAEPPSAAQPRGAPRTFRLETPVFDAGATWAQENNAADVARIRLLTAEQGIDALGVEIHKKFALSLACLVFVLFGAPIALRFPRGGVGLTIGVSLFVFALYYVGLIAGEAFADRDLLPPWLAMWGTNLVFMAVGLLLLRTVGSEGVSARGGEMTERLEAIRDRLRARWRGAPAVAAHEGRA
ncbi:MAG: LptF/LptG family permease [Gemmatimonadetes bacterium]|nr:LptF/LptG family permease [Gemmatimonadota bacterium]